MSNEKVFNYVGTSGKPLYSDFSYGASWIHFIDGTDSNNSFELDVWDTYRVAYSYYNKQGYKVGKDQNGNNMIIGAPDGMVKIKILEAYEIN